MLHWRQLTSRQKIQGVLILTIFIGGGAPAVAYSGIAPRTLAVLGALLCGISLILNPKAYSSPATDGVSWQEMPRLCHILLAIGMPAFLLGDVALHLG